MNNPKVFNQNNLFKKYVNSCVCNVKAAVRLYEESKDLTAPPAPAVLAYICQAHACAKQVQLLAGLLEINQYNNFYASFIELNNVFMRFAATGHNKEDVSAKYDIFIGAFDKLAFERA